MFSEIIKFKPQLDNSDLNKMERTLGQRFKKVAKSFGAGISNALKAGGIAGLAIGLIDKVLNPLKEVQDAIDKMLNTSDDIATNAKQFDTTTGRLAKLVQLGKASGLDQDSLFMLLTKFQTAVAEAKQDPTSDKSNAVKNFVNEKDTATAFFSFIQELKKMDKNNQILVQQAVFGEKQILKMSEFLNQDFGALMKSTGLDKIGSTTLGNALDKTAAQNDYKNVLAVRTETKDWIEKSKIITDDMIRQKDKADQLANIRENQRIASYNSLQNISQTTEKIMTLIEKGVSLFGEFVPKITSTINELVDYMKKFTESRWIRGIFGGDKKGE